MLHWQCSVVVSMKRQFSRILKPVLCACFFVILLACASMVSAADLPDPLVDNGCTDQLGNAQPNCSKLGARDKVTVKASECGYSTKVKEQADGTLVCDGAESAAVCRTIINDGDKNYFLPWRTAPEWGAFLRQLPPMEPLDPGAIPLPENLQAGDPPKEGFEQVSVAACCPAKPTPPICPDYPCTTAPGAPDCHSAKAFGLSEQLGARVVGVRSPDAPLLYYGAQNDVFGPIKAEKNFLDVNYEVTYSCYNGEWIKSYEQGSCKPMNGACNPDIDGKTLEAGVILTGNEPLEQFCVTGSAIYDTFKDQGDRYTWTCAGTPGMESKDCSVSKPSVPQSGKGVCGPANNGRFLFPPATYAQKCASGAEGILTGNGTQGSPWVWSCANINCQAFLKGTPLDGVCGSANGKVSNKTDWKPSQGELCNRSAAPAQIVKNGSILSWTCLGESGGQDRNCSASVKSVNGTCGVSSSFVTNKPPSNPPKRSDLPPNACKNGTPANITYDAVTSILSWTCSGKNGGADTGCTSRVDTSVIKGKCKWRGGMVLSALPSVSELCADGTPINVTTVGTPDNATLNWICQGNPPGSYDAACNIKVSTIPPGVDGVCGTANGKNSATKPSVGLCSPGIPSDVSGGSGANWKWTCAGTGKGAKTASCGAVYDGGGGAPVTIDGRCGSARGVATATAPQKNLCQTIGTSSAVSLSGASWVWQCSGINGGVSATCSAPLLGPAKCGLTNGIRIPRAPNRNLCDAGQPTQPVGDNIRGWEWTCVAADTVSCRADPCDTCGQSITLPPVLMQNKLSKQTIIYGSGTCEVIGSVERLQSDGLTIENKPFTLSLTAPGNLSYSKSQAPAASPSNFCSPCYRRPSSVTGALFTVQRASSSGVCNTGTPLDGGQSVVIPATGFTVTP